MSVDISAEINSLIEEIRDNKTDGASSLARRAVRVFKTAAERSQTETAREFLLEQKEIGKRLISVRPSMAPVANIVTRLLRETVRKNRGMDLESVRELTISTVDELVYDSLKAVSEISKYSSRLINDGNKILTHSYSSTVIAALKEIHTTHKNIEVVATRSGAGRIGEKTASELAKHGIPVTFIDDTAAGLYISTVDKVMVGADRICADGRVVNGIGTYQLALASEKAGIPFYVLCETLKFDAMLKSDDVELEEKEPSEVIEAGRLPPEVRVKNPYFDITPLELITAIVTENGVLTAEKLSTIWKEILLEKD